MGSERHIEGGDERSRGPTESTTNRNLSVQTAVGKLRSRLDNVEDNARLTKALAESTCNKAIAAHTLVTEAHTKVTQAHGMAMGLTNDLSFLKRTGDTTATNVSEILQILSAQKDKPPMIRPRLSEGGNSSTATILVKHSPRRTQNIIPDSAYDSSESTSGEC